MIDHDQYIAMRERRPWDLKPLVEEKKTDGRIPNEEQGDDDCSKQVPSVSGDKDTSFPGGDIDNPTGGFEDEAPSLEEEIAPEKRDD